MAKEGRGVGRPAKPKEELAIQLPWDVATKMSGPA